MERHSFVANSVARRNVDMPKSKNVKITNKKGRENMNLPPMALLMTVLFGASQSFLTPMGYQTNLMVFGPGRYRFLDVTRYGAGLTALMTIAVPALVLWQYKSF